TPGSATRTSTPSAPGRCGPARAAPSALPRPRARRRAGLRVRPPRERERRGPSAWRTPLVPPPVPRPGPRAPAVAAPAPRVVVVLLLVAVMVWSGRRRRHHLQDRFGSEYDRTVDASEHRRDAERALREREQRHDELELRPLSEASRQRYTQQWQQMQSEFV